MHTGSMSSDCPRSTRRPQMVVLVLALAFLAVGILVFMPPGEPDFSAAPRLSAESLSQAYQEDEHAADARYKGGLAQVSGTVERMVHSPAGDMVIQFGAGVVCILGGDQGERAAAVRAGSSIEVGGKVGGLAADGVVLHNCRIL